MVYIIGQNYYLSLTPCRAAQPLQNAQGLVLITETRKMHIYKEYLVVEGILWTLRVITEVCLLILGISPNVLLNLYC